jgi:hypothetical protein
LAKAKLSALLAIRERRAVASCDERSMILAQSLQSLALPAHRTHQLVDYFKISSAASQDNDLGGGHWNNCRVSEF